MSLFVNMVTHMICVHLTSCELRGFPSNEVRQIVCHCCYCLILVLSVAWSTGCSEATTALLSHKFRATVWQWEYSLYNIHEAKLSNFDCGWVCVWESYRIELRWKTWWVTQENMSHHPRRLHTLHLPQPAHLTDKWRVRTRSRASQATPTREEKGLNILISP